MRSIVIGFVDAVLAAALGALLVAPSGGAAAQTAATGPEPGTGDRYFHAVTPSGSSCPCCLTRDRDHLRRTLGEVGWTASDVDKLPPIDWAREWALVVAPGRFVGDATLTFAGWAAESGRWAANWRWRRFRAERPVPDPEHGGLKLVPTNQRRLNAPQTLVIPLRADADLAANVFCQQLATDY